MLRLAATMSGFLVVASSALASDHPDGIQVRETDVARVFTDAAGMTLYQNAGGPCTDKLGELEHDLNRLLLMYAKDGNVPTCAQQWPPAYAVEGSVAKGDWTIVKAVDGGNQWAYQGKPVHRFYKDLLPGDVNFHGNGGPGGGPRDNWIPAAPQRKRLPPGITEFTRIGVGRIAVRADGGGAIYVLDKPQKASARGRGSATCTVACDGKWSPLPAAEGARGFDEWSIVRLPDGRPVWRYRERLLHAYSGDHEEDDANGVGVDGAELVVLRPAPELPGELSVSVTPIGRLIADVHGKTVYEFSCTLPTPPGYSQSRYTCDGWNDHPLHREQFCPGLRCLEMWRPVAAPADAAITGGVWSVAVIPDLQYPLRWVPATREALQKPGAIRVRTHNGRPLYTSTRDEVPGDFHGCGVHNQAGQTWDEIPAAPRSAYETC